jgi:hypothetical protein
MNKNSTFGSKILALSLGTKQKLSEGVVQSIIFMGKVVDTFLYTLFFNFSYSFDVSIIES